MKKGWQTKPLGEVCKVIGGGTPSKRIADYYAGNIPWATVRDMHSPVISDTEFKITKDAVRDSATNIIPGGNVVIATRVGLGKVCLLGQDTAINQDLRGVLPNDVSTLSVRYLFLWFQSITQTIIAEGKGATVQGVTLPFIKSLQIPLPPLPEQKRIVGILDEAFAGIATAKANAEKNLQNARAVFESHLNAVFTQRGEGWEEKSLEEVVAPTCSLSYGIVQPGDDVPGGLPIVRPVDLSTKVIEPAGLKRIDPQLATAYERTQLSGGELLLCVRGSTGLVAVASPELTGANVTRGIVPIQFEKRRISQGFGYYALTSEYTQCQIRSKTYGAALMQINIRDLRKIAIRFPTLDEQNLLAANLDGLSDATISLESIYQQKLDALDALKKSLLHQAFSGNL